MRAVTWHGKRDVRVEEVPDPIIKEPSDAIIKVTSTAICGSDLHLYEVLGPYMAPGDVLGHEAMGVVEEVGAGVTGLRRGDRVVVPFNIACGACVMCREQLFAHCETTQVKEHGTGAALFGYSSLYGSVPGGQAEYLRVPFADVGPVVVPDDGEDEQYLFLSDVLPTAYQAVAYADVPPGGTLAVLGLGPIGQMCARIARLIGVERVFGVDVVPERLAMAAAEGIETIDLQQVVDVTDALLALTEGRGPHAVIDAVGMEACGAPVARTAQNAVGLLPPAVGRWVSDHAAVDRLDALVTAIRATRRGGTLSVVGVYGGQVDPLPMRALFDRGLQMRMGQAHVRRWIPDLMGYVQDPSDPLGTRRLVTHRLPLADAPQAYAAFQAKQDGCVKVVLSP